MRKSAFRFFFFFTSVIMQQPVEERTGTYHTAFAVARFPLSAALHWSCASLPFPHLSSHSSLPCSLTPTPTPSAHSSKMTKTTCIDTGTAVSKPKGVRDAETTPPLPARPPILLSPVDIPTRPPQGDSKLNRKALSDVLGLIASGHVSAQVLLIAATAAAAESQLSRAKDGLRPSKAKLHVVCAEAKPALGRTAALALGAEDKDLNGGGGGDDGAAASSSSPSNAEQERARCWTALTRASHVTGGLCLSLSGAADVLQPLCSEHLTAPAYSLHMGQLEAPVTLLPPILPWQLHQSAGATAAALS